MSLEIDWESIRGDPNVNKSINEFLNLRLQELELPSYVNNLKVTNFDLGAIAPEITLKQMDDPLDEFYTYLQEEGEIDGESMNDKNTDMQLLVELDYKGDMSIEVTAELVLNYPSPQFMLLPVKLRINDIGMHCLCLFAYLKKQMFISFLCDVSDPLLEDNKLQVDPNGPNFMGKRSLERISLIRNIKIHTELGQQEQGEGSVLRSVGKLEEFLVDIFRSLLRKEAAWPSWINLDFTTEDTAEGNGTNKTENTDGLGRSDSDTDDLEIRHKSPNKMPDAAQEASSQYEGSDILH